MLSENFRLLIARQRTTLAQQLCRTRSEHVRCIIETHARFARMHGACMLSMRQRATVIYAKNCRACIGPSEQQLVSLATIAWIRMGACYWNDTAAPHQALSYKLQSILSRNKGLHACCSRGLVARRGGAGCRRVCVTRAVHHRESSHRTHY